MKILRSLRQGGGNVYTLVKETFDEATCIETTLNLDFVSRPQATIIGKRKHPGDEVEDPEWIWAIVWGRGSAVRRKPLLQRLQAKNRSKLCL